MARRRVPGYHKLMEDFLKKINVTIGDKFTIDDINELIEKADQEFQKEEDIAKRLKKELEISD